VSPDIEPRLRPGREGSTPGGNWRTLGRDDPAIQRIEGRVLVVVDGIGDWREEIIASLLSSL
jgi:hypothetical protein